MNKSCRHMEATAVAPLNNHVFVMSMVLSMDQMEGALVLRVGQMFRSTLGVLVGPCVSESEREMRGKLNPKGKRSGRGNELREK